MLNCLTVKTVKSKAAVRELSEQVKVIWQHTARDSVKHLAQVVHLTNGKTSREVRKEIMRKVTRVGESHFTRFVCFLLSSRQVQNLKLILQEALKDSSIARLNTFHLEHLITK